MQIEVNAKDLMHWILPPVDSIRTCDAHSKEVLTQYRARCVIRISEFVEWLVAEQYHAAKRVFEVQSAVADLEKTK